MNSRKNPVPPTRAELRILKALWELNSGTIEEIIHHPSFASPPNYKTTQTILRIMEEKGLARHTTGGRVFVFEPAVSRDWVEKMCVRTILEQNFGGSPAKLLVNLLESGPVADRELEELEALIRNYRIQKGELQH
ncbi:MAG TPA: BlaI/MecI/CopY family transcriptional regulator [Candidatus Dormibacteraeota bacterium]|jgi:BlaI family penicillinase repressor|nr:BlaI/MecI/CopY family transcriptional regulator [Candidatus Dormibacteraeota bacterium]